jgi:DNA-binding transcriptional MerR regulator
MNADPRRADATLTVRRLAQQGGVTVHVVRNYLRRGLLRAKDRTAAGYRLFSHAEVQQLQFIRTAQRLGFTLAEIEEIMRRSRQRKSPCPLSREIINRRLEETRKQLEQLLALQSRMVRAAEHWATLPDSIPTGNDMCPLIEAIAALEFPGRPRPAPTRLPGRLQRNRKSA